MPFLLITLMALLRAVWSTDQQVITVIVKLLVVVIMITTTTTIIIIKIIMTYFIPSPFFSARFYKKVLTQKCAVSPLQIVVDKQGKVFGM